MDEISKILIIDDSITICENIKRILNDENIDILFAHTGKDGIELLKKYKLDLIFLDINLPDITGYEICKYIKCNRTINNIPVLFITSSSCIINLSKAFELGAIDYITKPFNALELKARIKAHLRMKHMYDELYESNNKLKLLVNENKKKSNIDPLTLLYNRRYLNSYINKIDKENGIISLIMGDIDNFKKINDTFGHMVGDEVLKKISEIIKRNCNKNSVAIRMGGEEFIILLKDTNIDEATNIAESIRVEINKDEIKIDNNIIKYTMTFGVSEFNVEEELEVNIKKVDKRLYMGKSKGKNCVINADF